MTPKRKGLEKEIKKAKKEVRKERPNICQGCGSRTMLFLDVSHRIPVGFKEWAADKDNMDLYCRNHDKSGCHDNYERGKIWNLNNGKEVMDWLKYVNEQRFYLKLYQMQDRLKEYKPEQIPMWALDLLKLI